MEISVSEPARRIGYSPQNFNVKEKDLKKIANVLGITYEQSFTLQNGDRIKITN